MWDLAPLERKFTLDQRPVATECKAAHPNSPLTRTYDFLIFARAGGGADPRPRRSLARLIWRAANAARGALYIANMKVDSGASVSIGAELLALRPPGQTSQKPLSWLGSA